MNEYLQLQVLKLTMNGQKMTGILNLIHQILKKMIGEMNQIWIHQILVLMIQIGEMILAGKTQNGILHDLKIQILEQQILHQELNDKF
jgi:hypothetical protein